jgi:hypothetical protein
MASIIAESHQAGKRFQKTDNTRIEGTIYMQQIMSVGLTLLLLGVAAYLAVASSSVALSQVIK